MKKLRLLITEDCNRNCAGCCNKQWDLKKLPVWDGNAADYDIIMLTGGEPLLKPEKVISIAEGIRHYQTGPAYMQGDPPKIIVYTAMARNVLHVLPFVDGVTLTLHDMGDIPFFKGLDEAMRYLSLNHTPWLNDASLRLNIFKEVSPSWPMYIGSWWKVKKDIEWIDDCPLPDDEVFMRVESI